MTGSELWRYSARGRIKSSPVFDADGNIVFGSEGKDLVTLTPEGGLISTNLLADKVTQSPSIAPSGNDITVRVADKQVVTVGRLPQSWDTDDPNFQDVWPNEACDLAHPSADCLYWHMVNPLSMDGNLYLQTCYIVSSVEAILGPLAVEVTIAIIDAQKEW